MKIRIFVFLLLCTLLESIVSCKQADSMPYDDSSKSLLIATDLSNQQVNAFAEDAQGYIWIGTFRGLNRHDVYEFHQYFCTEDSLSLPDNQVNAMLRDSQGRLWISTVNGLCRYTDQDDFVYVPTDAAHNNGLQLLESHDGRIFLNYMTELAVYNPTLGRMECAIGNLTSGSFLNAKCFIDAENDLWVASPTDLRCYDLSTFQLKDSVHVEGMPWFYYQHADGMLWLTGVRTITLYDTSTHRFADVPRALKEHAGLSQSTINLIHPYGDDCLLLNTTSNGLYCYNYVKNTVIHQDEEGFPFEVPDFRISCLFTDSRQNLWIGSVDQGFYVSYHYKKRFNENNYLRTFFHNKSVVSLAAEAGNVLWVATLNDGVYRYDFSAEGITKIDIGRLFPSISSKDIQVNQLLVDDDNHLWMITTGNEALKCSYREGQLQVEARYNIFLPMSMTKDESGNIWIGTKSPYVYMLKPNAKDFQVINAFDGGVSNNFTFIPGMLSLKNGDILAAAFNKPLKRIDVEGSSLHEIKVGKADWDACIRHSVFIPTVLYEDSGGDVWIGTVGNGLLRYSPSTGRLQPVHGAACSDISGIEEDLEGNLWISTLYGLSKFDRTTARFINYHTSDGIGGNQFYDRSSCRLPNGTLVFGGTHGLTMFYPEDVLSARNTSIWFKELKVHNRLVRPGKEACIDKQLSYNPDIRLRHDQNGFSISFIVLDYGEHERVHYYYKLEEFDQYWIDANNNREAYYANLPSGHYEFKVRIMDNDQRVVEGENSIRLHIEPAPWATWWAYLIYFLAGTGIIVLMIRLYMRIFSEKKAVLQAKKEQEQEQRINKMNMSFFANVSHEFRTPLTMIYGPITQLCGSLHMDEKEKKLLCTVQRSVQRMMQLVNQLLEFNQLENDTLRLQVKHADLIGILKQKTDLFEINARSKHITLSTYGLEGTFLMWLDEDKIDKIFDNLMSNALKFTPAGGKIKVAFDVVSGEEVVQQFPLQNVAAQYAQISVSNTGEPIPADKLEKIFERYYQLDNNTKGVYNWGTGIGLYYARSLAKLHHGYLKAKQLTEEKGSVFTFVLPIDDGAYSAEERAPKQLQQPEIFPLPEISESRSAEQGSEYRQDKPYTILIVDDDTEVVAYLNSLFSTDYHVICCFSCESALNTISENAPDIVVSDVVMAGKDGYWLCRSIKDDLQLCHIPVILLTAKTAIGDQVKGLDTGADAYVTKPFDPAYLQALVKSQLKNREKVRSLLTQATRTDKIAENVLSPRDNAFMTEIYQLMEKELSNPELDVVQMAEMLHISRTKFYYKIKGLTGKNPAAFFRTYKLNRAAELIAGGNYNVSEIADMTGFSTHSFFSKAFKKQFGVTPSEYGAGKHPA